jgi:hypothetical protein
MAVLISYLKQIVEDIRRSVGLAPSERSREVSNFSAKAPAPET